jgi:hypothetical protein
VISGQVDVGLAGPEVAIYIYNSESPDKPVMFCSINGTDGFFLVSRDKVEPFDWRMLHGRKIIGWRPGSRSCGWRLTIWSLVDGPTGSPPVMSNFCCLPGRAVRSGNVVRLPTRSGAGTLKRTGNSAASCASAVGSCPVLLPSQQPLSRP